MNYKGKCQQDVVHTQRFSWHSVHQLPNGSDHAVIACYEEGEVEHINGVRPSFLENTAVSRFVTFLRMLHTW